MITGLWSATGGMMAREQKQEVITNNLANASTAGFKRRQVAFRCEPQVFGAVLENEMNPLVPKTLPFAVVSTPTASGYQDTRPGSVQQTGNNLDLAIEGDGFFVVEERGVKSLTRSGSLALDSENELVTSAGEKVMGRNGVIRLPDGKWEIDTEGNIMSGGQSVDKILLASGVSPSGQPIESPTARVRSGCVEMSNVSTVTEMVDLIANLRGYETNQKVIQSIDQTLDKLINEAGK